jgi:hypothetical protein
VVFAHACALGLEGIVSKRRDAPYRHGRCRSWLKVKNPESAAALRVWEDRFDRQDVGLLGRGHSRTVGPPTTDDRSRMRGPASEQPHASSRSKPGGRSVGGEALC